MNLFQILSDVVNIKILGKVPVYYFHGEKNVGDLLTPYIVEKITGKPAHNAKSRNFNHLLGVGSMIHRAKKNSDIWGTGTLDKTIGSKYMAEELRIFALRGYLSAEALFGPNGGGPNISFGDPGVLMPRFFSPNIEKRFRVGVIPHYVDYESEFIRNAPGVKLIDVRSDPEEFICQMLECEFVLSSSLHGLILADAYGVKNKWVSFSDKVTGGGFKFSDYYSTTDCKGEECVSINSRSDFINLVDRVDEYASLKVFLECGDKLLSSFPAKYF